MDTLKLSNEILSENLDLSNDESFSNLISLANNNKLYLTLIVVDLTSSNSTGNYESGDKIKAELISTIQKEIPHIYMKIIGGKIIFFAREPLTSNMKKKIDILSKELLNQSFSKKNKSLGSKKIILDSRKFVFIIDKDEHNIELTIGPFNQELNSLLVDSLNKEEYLSKLRAKLQLYLKKSNANLSEIEEVEKSYSAIENSITKYSQYDFLSQNQEIKTQSFKKAYQNAKSSKYLSNALTYYSKIGTDEKYELLTYYELIKYKIWTKLQQVLFHAYKIEKANEYIHPFKNKLEIFDLKKWFDSVFVPLYPYLNIEEQQKTKQIKNYIDNIDLTQQKNAKLFSILVHDFIQELNIKGIFNVPLSNLEISSLAQQFQTRQYYLNFGEQYKEKLANWYNKSFIKIAYPIVASNTKEFSKAIIYVNSTLLANTKDILCSHMAFVEIDGFNAFNSFLFPTDSDKLYNEMLNSFLEVANEFLTKDTSSKELFKTMSMCILGDEFFINFLSSQKLTSSQEDIIYSYIKQVQSRIVKMFEKYYFVKTDKIKIKTANGKVTFRTAIAKGNIFQNFDVELAQIGVSAVIKCNSQVQFNSASNPKIDTLSFSIDKKIIEDISEITRIMTNYIKKKKKGEIMMIE